ncbi:DUF4270 domain-containing protein [Reichenbachiella agarivorans]|uniref:DUF4270 domain-containing protein n=1 Tax=Reichenbachiella agarivorans TaxID=2979464 RepID=A0ABY6CRG7_9BACT|nr:DUF4270 domain-containing protein [Reichenbachiella agarivorans]UXP33110.1 DUF4270 domain-containing protein [Reichenbachiella agarivorans]
MSLLDKNCLGLLTFAAFFIFSCEDPSEVGLGLDPDGVASGVFYEEIYLPAQNVFIDSLRTSGNTRLLVGSVTDDVYGKTSAMSYNQLSTTSGIQSLGFKLDTVSTSPLVVDTLWYSYVVDSTVLTLGYDYIHSKESIKAQTIRVYEVDDQLFSGVYYLSKFNTPILPLEAGNEFSFVPRLDSIVNETVDTVKFYLKREWGDRLFDIARQSNRATLLATDFKGIAIGGGDDNTSIIGFTSTGYTALNVHYHIVGPDSNKADSVYFDSLAVNFSLSASAAKYNKITTDRTGSLIGTGITNLGNFDVDDGNVYLNAAAGIYPKIDMQPLVDFLRGDEQELIQINNLEFELPTDGEETTLDEKVSQVRLYFVGDSTQINVQGLTTNDIYNTGVLKDIGYLTGALDLLSLAIDTTSFSYRGAATFFGHSIANGYIFAEPEDVNEEVYNKVVVMPVDLGKVNQTVIPKDGIKVKVFYSKPN